MGTRFFEFDDETMNADEVDLYERDELPLDDIWGNIGDSARDVYQLLGVDEDEEEDEFYWDSDWEE